MRNCEGSSKCKHGWLGVLSEAASYVNQAGWLAWCVCDSVPKQIERPQASIWGCVSNRCPSQKARFSKNLASLFSTSVNAVKSLLNTKQRKKCSGPFTSSKGIRAQPLKPCVPISHNSKHQRRKCSALCITSCHTRGNLFPGPHLISQRIRLERRGSRAERSRVQVWRRGSTDLNACLSWFLCDASTSSPMATRISLGSLTRGDCCSLNIWQR
jgi:hypothetical protein